MKKFVFPFERAMDWRERKADQERQELTRLHSVRSTLEQRQDELALEASAVSNNLAVAEAISGSDLRSAAAYLASLRTATQDLLRLQANCKSEIETQTQRCVTADRDFRLLERLKDKRLATWEYEYQRESEQTATEAWQAARGQRRKTKTPADLSGLR